MTVVVEFTDADKRVHTVTLLQAESEDDAIAQATTNLRAWRVLGTTEFAGSVFSGSVNAPDAAWASA